jgi:multiple sugar transport system substrate-binding protein
MTGRVLALLASAVLVVAACGRAESSPAAGGSPETSPASPGASPAGSASASAAANVSGPLQVWAMGTEGEKLGTLTTAFMTEHPDVQVEVTAVPWDAAHDRIVNAIAGGQVPDVSLIGTTWMGEFAKLGGLDPTPADIDPGLFFGGAWDTTKVDGTSYGVPWYVETRLVYYRTDMAKEGGVTDAPQDWDQLKALAEAQKKAGAKVAIALQPGGTGSWQTFMPFFWQAGGEILDAGGQFTLDSDACHTALAYYDSFFEEGLASKTVSDTPVEGQFANGEAGAFISGPWMIGVVTDAGADPATWTVAHQPTNVAGTSFVGGGNLGVFAQSDNKEAAWELVRYLSRPEVQKTWYETVKDLPAAQAAWEDPTLSGDPLLAAFGEQLKDAKAPPSIPTWEQVANAIDGAIEQVTVGDKSPEDGCAQMQSEAQSIGTGL